MFVLYMFYTIFTLCRGDGKISLQFCFKEVLCYFWFFKGHVNLAMYSVSGKFIINCGHTHLYVKWKIH